MRSKIAWLWLRVRPINILNSTLICIQYVVDTLTLPMSFNIVNFSRSTAIITPLPPLSLWYKNLAVNLKKKQRMENPQTIYFLCKNFYPTFPPPDALLLRSQSTLSSAVTPGHHCARCHAGRERAASQWSSGVKSRTLKLRSYLRYLNGTKLRCRHITSRLKSFLCLTLVTNLYRGI